MNKKIKAFAKVNLGLKVGRIDPHTNMHPIESTFTLVKNFYDEIYVTEIEDGIIINSNIKEICNNNNFVYKVVEFIIKEYNLKKGFEIYINKKIPIGSGMGGGNSDAIAVAKYLEKKFKLKNLNYDILCQITGFDSYFFASGFRTAKVSNFGQKILKSKTKIKIRKKDLIISPKIKCDTKAVYNEFDKIEGWKNYNDTNMLTKAAINLYPELKELSEKYVMSGSGSTFIIKRFK